MTVLREFVGAFILPTKGRSFALAPDSLSKNLAKAQAGGLLI